MTVPLTERLEALDRPARGHSLYDGSQFVVRVDARSKRHLSDDFGLLQLFGFLLQAILTAFGDALIVKSFVDRSLCHGGLVPRSHLPRRAPPRLFLGRVDR